MTRPEHFDRQLFKAPCDALSTPAEADYALLISRERQPVALFADLECDAQLMCAAAEDGWDDVLTDIGEAFVRANRPLACEDLGILFVPRSQEAAVHEGIRRLIARWSSGQDSSRGANGTSYLGYFGTGLVMFGTLATPAGLFVVYADSGNWVLGRDSLVDFLGSGIGALDADDLPPTIAFGDRAVFLVLDEAGSGNAGSCDGDDDTANVSESQGATATAPTRFFTAYEAMVEDGAGRAFLEFFQQQVEQRRAEGVVTLNEDQPQTLESRDRSMDA